jgi:hypothetical protein
MAARAALSRLYSIDGLSRDSTVSRIVLTCGLGGLPSAYRTAADWLVAPQPVLAASEKSFRTVETCCRKSSFEVSLPG